MPRFAYLAADAQGTLFRGVVLAPDEGAVDALLRSRALWVVETRPAGAAGRVAAPRVKRRDLADFCAALAALLAAGVNIADALRTVAEEARDPGFRSVIEELAEAVSAGSSLVDAMAEHPKLFGNELLGVLASGEYSGNLAASFRELAQHLEWVDALIADVKQASIYPAMVLAAVSGFVLLLFAFVVPSFAEVFDTLDIPLPAVTRAVLAVGAWARDWWWLALGLPASTLAAAHLARRTSPSAALVIDGLKLRVPVFGDLQRTIALSRLSHHLALLSRAGVPLPQALELVEQVVDNAVFARALRAAARAVTEGRRLSETLRLHGVFPPLVLRMVVVGEETGLIDQSLQAVAERYQHELPRRIKRLFAILEPSIITALLVIVGVVAMALFMPLMSLMDHLR